VSNRIIKHSSRYHGPAGDSRPSVEIFAGIEARNQQAQEYREEMISIMDGIMENANLMSPEGRLALIRETAIDWLYEHDPNLPKREEGK
jgi:hypothetical protein